MREPFVTDFLWRRYRLLQGLARNDSRQLRLCALQSMANSSLSDSRQARSDFDFWLRYAVVSWMFPLLWLLGIVGILMTLITIRRHPKVVPSTTRVWLASLFIVDGLVLTVVGSRWWTYTVFGAHLRNSQPVPVSAYNYVNYLLVQLSSWLQACIFVERVLVVRDPMLAKTYLRPQRARLGVLFLLLTLAVLNLPVALLTYHFADVIVADDSTVWLVCAEWAYIGLKVVGMSDLALGSVLPLVIMLGGTIIISAALLSKKALRDRREAAACSGGNSRAHQTAKRRKRQRRICIVSLSMNALYLVTNYPLTVVLLYTTFSRRSVDSPATLSAFPLLYLLSLVNNASNWALLTLTGRGYRKKLTGVLLCWQRKHPLLRRRGVTRGSAASAMVIVAN